MDTIKMIFSAIGDFLYEFFILSVKENMSVKAVIDILLLSLVLFFIYKLVRDSRAGKLLAGLAVLLIVSLMSDFFGLKALDFIFGDFHQIAIIVILVLFQPELRTALEKVGGTPMGIKSMAAESSELATLNAEVDAICTAVNDLSRDKVGALIVIERSTKLGEFVKSGVYVDAVISPYILRNIFFNKAPLHDGAVIIRNSRICAAGCFLPLSTKEDINKDLGTRHRAAIGLTEISDALVVVVSEETGTISLSVGGALERNFNYRSLKQTLINYLSPQKPTDNAKSIIEKANKRRRRSKKSDDISGTDEK